MRPKSGFKFTEGDLSVTCESGKRFRMIVKHNRINQLDFSVILLFEGEDGSRYRLTRYNVIHSSSHTNKYEKMSRLVNAEFSPAFHIHTATERYQISHLKIDGSAEMTDRYNDLTSAINEFISGCGFIENDTSQGRLF